jgi:cytoskeleton protein RodZ
MSAFGENLRREREMRGVSLEEISSATKISLRFLEAIEREEFSKLPGGIFSRSFIRTYARYLGLDEERVVAEYQLAARPQVDFDLHRMAAGNSSAGRPAARTSLISALIVVVLLVGGYWLFRYSQRAAEAPAPPPPAPVETPKAAAPPAPTTNCVDTTAVPAPAVGEATPESAAPLKPNCVPAPPSSEATPGATPGTAPGLDPNLQGGLAAGANPAAPSNPPTGNPPGTKPASDTELELQVAATERVWVGVDADGKTVFQRALNPQEVQTLHAHQSFDVTAGNAQSIILTLNGQTLKPLGRRGEVKSIHLTREDLKNSAP